jgi:hypothetical protein
MMMNTMTCIATQPLNHKSLTSGNRAGARSTQTRRLLRAFALLAICTIAFYAAPVKGSERTETQTQDTCKLTGTSHIWTVGKKSVVLKAEVTPEYSGGEFKFYIPNYFAGDPEPLQLGAVKVIAGAAQIKAQPLPEDKAPDGKWRTFQFYGIYVPPKGAPRAHSTGCKTNEWSVTVKW